MAWVDPLMQLLPALGKNFLNGVGKLTLGDAKMRDEHTKSRSIGTFAPVARNLLLSVALPILLIR
jgi:hypothetical protein